MADYFCIDDYQSLRLIKGVKKAVKERKHVTFTVHSENKKGGRNQKNYAHKLFQILAMETGWTYDEVKYDYFKRSCNPDIFIYDRVNPITGEVKSALRSIEDPNINLTVAIERFMNRVSLDHGLDLPQPYNKIEMARYEHLAQFYKHF
jgi:hypothetical protein